MAFQAHLRRGSNRQVFLFLFRLEYPIGFWPFLLIVGILTSRLYFRCGTKIRRFVFADGKVYNEASDEEIRIEDSQGGTYKSRVIQRG